MPDETIWNDEPDAQDPGVEEPASGQVAPRAIEELLGLDPMAPLTDQEEQLIRDHFGYGASERRTRAERARTAAALEAEALDRLTEAVVETRADLAEGSAAEYLAERVNGHGFPPGVPLPPDIEMVWGDDYAARFLIQAWGVEAFRGSRLHQLALLEIERQERLRPVQDAFIRA